MPPDTEWVVAADEAGVRLDKFLAARGRLSSRARAVAALERRKVFVNGVEASLADAARPVAAGDVDPALDRSSRQREARPARRTRGQRDPLDVVFEDDALIVVNKPAGLLAVPSGAQSRRAVGLRADRRSFETSRVSAARFPCIVSIRTRPASSCSRRTWRRSAAQGSVQAARTGAHLLAVVYGVPDPRRGDVARHPHLGRHGADTEGDASGRPARRRGDQRVSRRRSVLSTSLVEVRLRTGRRNQIRLQARLRGHTLVGETRYVHGPRVASTHSLREAGAPRLPARAPAP